MKLKLIAATAAILMTTSAQAAIITFTTPISVPNNTTGVYVNLVTGVNALTPAAAPGWDFNPWGSTTNGLSFFWPSTPAASSGGVASATTGGAYTDLVAGTVVSGASIFATAGTTGAFKTTGTHVIGLRFFNEATSAINYGYVTLSTTGTTGFPATILGWSYENTGAAITVGGAASAVPEPATWGLMLAGFGMVGFGMRRRRAVKTTVAYA